MDRFRTMYQNGEALEETYVMGNRMVAFLTEDLTAHPEFHNRSTAGRRKQSFKQLKELQTCLDDVALKIDEIYADNFVENFDPLLNESVGYDSDDDVMPGSSLFAWAQLGNKFGIGDKLQVESPARTVDTSGSESWEASDDASSDEDDMPARRIIFSDEVDEPNSNFHPPELGTEFLELIASETVDFETDSEAMDSWAHSEQREGHAGDLSSSDYSQTQRVICDPAKLALFGFTMKAKSSSSDVRKASCWLPRGYSVGCSAPGTPHSNDSVSTTNLEPIDRVPAGEKIGGTESDRFFVEAEDDVPSLSRDSAYSNEGLSHVSSRRPVSFRETILRQRRGYQMVPLQLESSGEDSGRLIVSDAEKPTTAQRHGCPLESAVMSEIEKFLDSSFEYDPSIVFDPSMERLHASVSSRTEVQLSGKRVWPPRPNAFHPKGASNVVHSGGDAWVYFD